MSTGAGQELVPPAALRLPARAESVREARLFLRRLLAAADRSRWIDSAELALSEVVTNGVLHAHTQLTVRAVVRNDVVEVEVADGNPTLPIQRRAHHAEATTGRGLELVSALTRDCGVRPGPAGKVVWFTVGDETDEPAEAELLAAWDDVEWAPQDGRDEPSAPPAAPDLQQVVLRSMPTALWLAAREHHQALLRELVLHAAEHEDTAATLPDLALADKARHLIWTALLVEVERVRGDARPVADAAGGPLPDVPDSVDLPLALAPQLGACFAALQDALDVGEQLAVADRLLVRPALPEIIAVRDWACEQVVAQLAGVPAAPWPGADQSRFVELVHDRSDPDEPQWDITLVTQSDRGVAAADEANRILAISEPLARATGWDPIELVGRRVVALVPPELREAHVAGFSRHVTTGQSRVMGSQLRLPVLRRDGSSIECTFLVERAEVGSGRPVYLAWIEPVEPLP